MGIITFKECPRCGLLFDCYCQSEAYKCWCASFTLAPELTEYLKNNYTNCLCPKCIQEFLENGLPNPLETSKK